MRKKTKKIPLDVSIHLRMLYNEHGLRGQQLLDRYPEYTKASIYSHAKKPICEMTVDERKHNPGRPRKLSERDERAIIRQVAMFREYRVYSFKIKFAVTCQKLINSTKFTLFLIVFDSNVCSNVSNNVTV